MNDKGVDFGHDESKSIMWMTFEGEIKTLSEIDHQHLSNIFYYMHYTMPGVYDMLTINLIKEEIVRRFDDILLPYRPLRRFEQEIKVLNHRGWLWSKPSGIGHNVIINGKWIGEVDESIA